jgi:hypothetical protein
MSLPTVTMSGKQLAAREAPPVRAEPPADAGVLKHGVTKSAHAAVWRGFRLGEDVNQPTACRRLGAVSNADFPTLFNASITAAESMASRMTACPISNGLADDAELPKTMATLCMSSIPADVDATDENSPKSRRMHWPPTLPSISPSATATPSAEAPRE